MKTAKEMTESVLRRRDAHIRERKALTVRLAASAASVAVVCLIGLTALTLSKSWTAQDFYFFGLIKEENASVGSPNFSEEEIQHSSAGSTAQNGETTGNAGPAEGLPTLDTPGNSTEGDGFPSEEYPDPNDYMNESPDPPMTGDSTSGDHLPGDAIPENEDYEKILAEGELFIDGTLQKVTRKGDKNVWALTPLIYFGEKPETLPLAVYVDTAVTSFTGSFDNAYLLVLKKTELGWECIASFAREPDLCYLPHYNYWDGTAPKEYLLLPEDLAEKLGVEREYVE